MIGRLYWVGGLLLGLLALSGRTLVAQSPSLPSTLTVADWRKDLRILAAELPRRHANAFHTISRAHFDRMVADIDRQLPSSDVDQAVVGLASIVASVGDGHTTLQLPGDWPRYAIVPAWFGCAAGSTGPCELRITSTAPDARRALGARVIRIDTVTVEEAHRRLTSIIPKGESDGAVWGSSTGLLNVPNVLHGLGIVQSSAHAMFELEDSTGTRFTLTVSTVPRQTPVQAWPSASAQAPVSRQRFGEPLWWTLLPDSQTVYVAFNSYPDVGTFKRLTSDLMAFVNQHQSRRLVIDLRRNTGGDFTKVRRTLLPALRQHPVISQRGHLYVLIGPVTFSAAMTNAVDFRNEAHAILVGLPTGARPNGYQEGDEFRLPRSGLVVGYSTRLYRFQQEDTPGVMPDQRVEPTWTAFREGRDLALEWVLAQPLPAGR